MFWIIAQFYNESVDCPGNGKLNVFCKRSQTQEMILINDQEILRYRKMVCCNILHV